MKLNRFTLPLALTFGAVAVTPALAGSYSPAPADQPVIAAAPVPVPAPSGDWGGAYAGLQLGYADVNVSGASGGDGEIYGFHVGYRWDMGTLVTGIELDYDRADIGLAGGTEELDDVWRLKGQVGYDMGSTMLYGTAGAARAGTSLGDETGPFVGVGLAWQPSPSWIIGGEVLYHDFDEFGSSGVGGDATTATLRASFRF
ncbi:porin family protein [Rhodovulum tesquicola]|uniref:outer membrane protein n=1 Tax=Rhodovulum tesquicola TaxID=540254 RepID=UPI002096FE4A|nr:outer membrane beta-barrel protein [Rhodovulum tesquicola]MCO8144269.1 porin family protein [Rhodovulum tesquicola]